MSTQSSSGSSDNSFDIEELLQIGSRCRERLELHVKTLSKVRTEDEKRIQELERELKNCSQEIDYLQDQLNARNEEVYCLGEHVHSLELKLADMESLEEEVGKLREELRWSNSERLNLMQELESKEVELQKSASCIEKLEESISFVALEYQCEIESMKLDLTTLEQSCFEAKKFEEEAAQEELRMNESIQDFELQIRDAQKVIECLNKENKELMEKLNTSEKNARVFCQKMEQQFEEWLENKDGPQLNIQSLSHELEKDISTCGDILGPLLSRLAVDADFKDKMDKMSCQILEYELLVKQLKEELRAEKLKAKEEAEELAQEMAELRYQFTGLLEEERKRRACIEQISLQRIAELEAQIQREGRKTFNSVRLIHEA